MKTVLENAKTEIKFMYNKLDRFVQGFIKKEKHKITCTRGCSNCCRIMVLVALAEGLRIADMVLRMPKERRLYVTQRLKNSAATSSTTIHEYANMGHSCAFLDAEGKECTIYEERPAACRYHYVISDPERCTPGMTKEIIQLDLLPCENAVQGLSEKITGHLLAAPLPNMVLYCMVKLDPTKKKAVRGVADPIQWLKASARREDLRRKKEDIKLTREEVEDLI